VDPEIWTGYKIHKELMDGRRRYSVRFKARVALEAAKAEKAINEIASEYGIHPQQVRAWKRELLQKMHLAFERPKESQAPRGSSPKFPVKRVAEVINYTPPLILAYLEVLP